VTKAVVAKKADEAKKAADEATEAKRMEDEAAGDATAAQAKAAAAKKAADAEAAKQAAEANAAKKVAKAEAANKVAEAKATKKVTGAEKATTPKSSEAESPHVAISVLKEQVVPKGARAPRGSGTTSTALHKEWRSKMAADPARTSNLPALDVDTASTEAAMHTPCPEDGEELRTASQMPMASLTFAEMHIALGRLHVVSNMSVEYGLLPVPEGRLWLKGRVESLSNWSQTTDVFPVVYLRRPR
jgi:hypothetical protein